MEQYNSLRSHWFLSPLFFDFLTSGHFIQFWQFPSSVVFINVSRKQIPSAMSRPTCAWPDHKISLSWRRVTSKIQWIHCSLQASWLEILVHLSGVLMKTITFSAYCTDSLKNFRDPLESFLKVNTKDHSVGMFGMCPVSHCALVVQWQWAYGQHKSSCQK